MYSTLVPFSNITLACIEDTNKYDAIKKLNYFDHSHQALTDSSTFMYSTSVSFSKITLASRDDKIFMLAFIAELFLVIKPHFVHSYEALSIYTRWLLCESKKKFTPGKLLIILKIIYEQ